MAEWQKKKKIGKIQDLMNRTNSVDQFINKQQGFLVVCHIIMSHKLGLFGIHIFMHIKTAKHVKLETKFHKISTYCQDRSKRTT